MKAKGTRQVQTAVGIPGRKVTLMAKIDTYEKEILTAFEKGGLKSVASKGELEKPKEAAGRSGRVNRKHSAS
jgi:hypothetical protein